MRFNRYAWLWAMTVCRAERPLTLQANHLRWPSFGDSDAEDDRNCGEGQRSNHYVRARRGPTPLLWHSLRDEFGPHDLGRTHGGDATSHHDAVRATPIYRFARGAGKYNPCVKALT